MKKIFFILLLPVLFSSQSKKEQIIILNGKIDSLKYENFNHSLKISELNSQNSELINSNSRLMKEKQSLISENDSLKNNQKKAIAEKQDFLNRLKVLQDSLQNIQSQMSIVKKKTDWELMGLKGKVKSKTTYYWNGAIYYDYECDNNYSSLNIDLLFNDTGGIIEYKAYNSENSLRRSLQSREINKYDGTGNRIESKTYDENGKLSSLSIFSGRKEIESKYYDENGKVRLRFVYVYDDYGNKIAEKQYDEKGKLYSQNIFLFDSKGNIIEEKYFEDGTLQSHLKYKIEYYNQ